MMTRQVRAMAVYLAIGTCIQSACLLGYIAAARVSNDAPKHMVAACFLGFTAMLFFAAARRFTYRQLVAMSLVLACIASASLQVLGHVWFKGIFKDVDFLSLWNLQNIGMNIGIVFLGYVFLSTLWHLVMLHSPDLKASRFANGDCPSAIASVPARRSVK
jgi:hypothetical protein